MLVFIFAALAITFAQETVDSIDSSAIYTGAEMTVIGDRFVSSPALSYTNSSILTDSLFLIKHRHNFQEALQSDAGVYVKSGQIPGRQSPPFINGGSSANVNFLIDGLPVAFPQLQQFDLDYQSPYGAQGLEIIPGSHSALYGSGAMAGTINIITKRDFPKGAITRIELATGDFGYNWLGLMLNHHLFDRVGINISGNRLKSAGEFSGEGSRTENVSAKVLSKIFRGLDAEFFAQSHRCWLDYFSWQTLSHQFDDNVIGAMHLNGNFGNFSFRGSGQLERYRQEYSTDAASFTHEGKVVTGDVRFGADFEIISPSAFLQTRIYDLSSTSSGKHKVSALSCGAQIDGHRGKFSALISARLDRDITDSSLFSLGGGARYDFSNELYCAVSSGLGFRSPTPNDLWWQRTLEGIIYMPVVDTLGDTIWQPSFAIVTHGNNSLDAERSFSISTTWGYETASIDASVSAFSSFYRALIQWNSEYVVCENLDTMFIFPTNIDAASILGTTARIEVDPLKWLHLSGSYTFLSAMDSSKEKLPERPDHFLSGTIDAKYSIWEEKLIFRASVQPMYIGKIRYFTDEEISPGFLLSAFASVRFLDFELYGNIQNMTDNRYMLSDGRKELGRRIRFGVSWDFAD